MTDPRSSAAVRPAVAAAPMGIPLDFKGWVLIKANRPVLWVLEMPCLVSGIAEYVESNPGHSGCEFLPPPRPAQVFPMAQTFIAG